MTRFNDGLVGFIHHTRALDRGLILDLCAACGPERSDGGAPFTEADRDRWAANLEKQQFRGVLFTSPHTFGSSHFHLAVIPRQGPMEHRGIVLTPTVFETEGAHWVQLFGDTRYPRDPVYRAFFVDMLRRAAEVLQADYAAADLRSLLVPRLDVMREHAWPVMILGVPETSVALQKPGVATTMIHSSGARLVDVGADDDTLARLARDLHLEPRPSKN